MKILNTLKTPWFHQKLTTEKTKLKRDLKSVIVQFGGMVTHPSPIKTQKIIYFPSPRAAIAATALES